MSFKVLDKDTGANENLGPNTLTSNDFSGLSYADTVSDRYAAMRVAYKVFTAIIIAAIGAFFNYKNGYILNVTNRITKSIEAKDGNSETSGIADNESVSLRAVSVEPIEERRIERLFQTQANLQPIKEVILRAPVGVTVQSVKTMWGEKVKKGQILAHFDSETQKIKNELDRLDLLAREKEFNLNKKLAERNYISGSEFEQREVEFKSASLRQKINELESARVLKSPVDGIVSEISIRQGDFVDGNQNSLIKVIDNNAFKILLYVPQSVATKIKSGDHVTLAHDDTTGIGKISAVSPAVDPKTGSVLAEIISKKVPKEWISGMYVDVKIPLDVADNAIGAPVKAILYEDSKPYVYKVSSQEDERQPSSNSKSTDKVKKVWIKTKITDGQYTQVIDGLDASDLVVVKGQNLLKDGSEVEIQE